ncbi:MAG: hypothetical protein ACRYHA_34325 [Janthinobacterium lividum]
MSNLNDPLTQKRRTVLERQARLEEGLAEPVALRANRRNIEFAENPQSPFKSIVRMPLGK